VDCVLTALALCDYMRDLRAEREATGLPAWQLRLGINTGPLVAGVIGTEKFAYDVWGDTVNTASRLESSGEPGRVNISAFTHEIVKDFFICEYRGLVKAKSKGEIAMYFANTIHPELSENGDGRTPNEKFKELYRRLMPA
jgi:class 3 adenylate cyclase